MKNSKEVQNCSTLDGEDTLHITQRDTGVWYYQRRIPTSSQPFYQGKKQFKKSLKTKDKKEARILARRLSTELDAEFKKHQALQVLTPKDESVDSLNILEQQAKLQHLEQLAEHGANNYLGYQAAQLDPLMSDEQKESAYYAFSNTVDDFFEWESSVRNSDSLKPYDLHKAHAWRMFEGSFNDSSFESYSALSEKDKQRLFINFVQRLGVLAPSYYKRLRGESIDLPSYTEKAHQANLESPEYASKSKESQVLSICIKEYLNARKLDHIQDKTLRRYEARLNLLLRILGDRPVASLKRADALLFKSKLVALPANINKKKEYLGLSIDEILTTKPKPMASNTANDTLTDANSFFEWCLVNEYIERNVFTKLKVKTEKKDSESRAIFSKQDLATLFAQDYYQGSKPKHPHYYWLPLLALYTGARMNELCQLYVEDIQKDDESGCWTIDITDKREDQKLKNRSSRRTIPIHSKLIDLGFVDYVQSISHPRIFPELKLQRDGYQQAASKWFARFRDKVLPNAKAENKTFHSFRHTVADNLKQQGINKSPVAAILGHGEDSETFGRYGKAYVMDILKPIVESIQFNLDLKDQERQ